MALLHLSAIYYTSQHKQQTAVERRGMWRGMGRHRPENVHSGDDIENRAAQKAV